MTARTLAAPSSHVQRSTPCAAPRTGGPSAHRPCRAHATGYGATAGPRICAWCHAPLADDARAEAIGGAELHAECALSFDAWANDGHGATPDGCSDD